MNIKYTLEPRDMRAFVSYNRRHNASIKRTRYFFYLFFAVLSLCKALTYHDPHQRVVVFFIYIATYCLVLWLLDHLFRFIVQWRSFTPQRQPALFCEHTISLEEAALVETTHVNEARHLWPGVLSVIDGKNHIYIYVRPNGAHIIPKRSFPNTETERAFFQRAWELYLKAHRAA